MGLKFGTVKLYPYDKNWIKEFEKEKTALKEIFKDLALSIEHIGSTSIPELSAKPIIDIAVGVEKLKDFEKVRHIFEINKEYSVKENPTPGEFLVRKGPEDNITHLIHIMEYTSQRYIDSILFRDYITNHQELKEEYEKLKHKLSKKYANNRPMYTSSKNNFIQSVLKEARKKDL